MTQRAVRYWVGIPLGLGLAFADHVDSSKNEAYIQAAIWTVFVLVELVNELRKYADRKVLQQLFLFGVVPLHALIVYQTFRIMPFEYSLLVFALAYAETVVLAIVFLRIGQEIDPDGPLGLTEADRKRVRPRLFRW